eukprot:m.133101 g.133101  ORF g.133101 m.133101 type:complete len:398 (-) comp16873_c0_seq2:247-1440(-)
MASALKALGVPEPASEVFPYAYKHPEGFSGIANDPVWDDDKHLSIGNPDRVVDLKDFGYSDKELAPLATTFGQTSTFSLLSPQGIRDLNTVLDQVEPFAKETPRIRKVLRGGALRSKFLFDLSYSPKILAHVSKIAGCGLVPHPTIMNAAHTNYKPDGSTKSVDKWHTDTTAFVVVIFATDPDEYEGGNFRYFQGTRAKAFRHLKEDKSLPADKVHTAGLQRQGWALFQQGSLVPHAVSGVTKGRRRTTVVLSYTPANPLAFDASPRLERFGYNDLDPLHVALPDWLRFKSWKAAGRLALWLQSKAGSRGQPRLRHLVEDTRKALRTLAQDPPATDDMATLRDALHAVVDPLRSSRLVSLNDPLMSGTFAELDLALKDMLAFKHATGGREIFFESKI